MNEPNVAALPSAVGKLVRQIESLWESGQDPNPDALLESAGVSLPAHVAIKCKLRDHERTGFYVQQGAVHFSLIVFKDSQV